MTQKFENIKCNTCLVEVLMTAHFPLRCESRSTLAPSSSSPCGSMSKIYKLLKYKLTDNCCFLDFKILNLLQ